MPVFFALGALVAGVAALWWYSVPVLSSMPMLGTSTASVVSSDDVEQEGAVAQVVHDAAPEAWRAWFPEVLPMKIGEVSVVASVADTEVERMQGLSDTPYLPPEVVKLFVFEVPGYYGFWMKDMNYPIDIMWVDSAGRVVHIEHSVDPQTYPRTLMPSLPALYVIEAVAGFARDNRVTVGTPVALPGMVGR